MPRQIYPRMRESPTLSSFALEDVAMSQRCKAIEDICRKSFQKGYHKGLIRGRIMVITGAMENLGLTLDEAMSAAGVPENERDFYIQKIRQKTS